MAAILLIDHANLSRLDLNLLVVLEAIHAEGNLTRAARRLNLSQPALSHALARLREALDDPLFLRQGNRMVPTARTQRLMGPLHTALGLITECARRFPGGRMMFDLAPAWFARGISSGLLRPTLGYRVPAMPFSMTPSELADLRNKVPGIRGVHDIPLPPGRGRVFNAVTWAVQRLPLFDPVRPVFTLLEFG